MYRKQCDMEKILKIITSKSSGARIHSSESFGRSKVGDLDHTAVRIDENVVAFDIAVDDLIVVLSLDTNLRSRLI